MLQCYFQLKEIKIKLVTLQCIFKGNQKCSVTASKVSEQLRLEIQINIEKQSFTGENKSCSYFVSKKSLSQFVLFELCFNNVKILPNEHGLPERKKKSC